MSSWIYNPANAVTGSNLALYQQVLKLLGNKVSKSQLTTNGTANGVVQVDGTGKVNVNTLTASTSGGVALNPSSTVMINNPINNVVNIGCGNQSNYPTLDTSNNIISLSGSSGSGSAIELNGPFNTAIVGASSSGQTIIGTTGTTFGFVTGMTVNSAGPGGNGGALGTGSTRMNVTATGVNVVALYSSSTGSGIDLYGRLIAAPSWHTYTSGSSPGQYTASTGMGTSPTSISVTGTDTVGQISFKMGTSPPTGNPIIQIYFQNPFPSGCVVFLQADNFVSGGGNWENLVVILNNTANSFTISNNSGAALTANLTYNIAWLCIGY